MAYKTSLVWSKWWKEWANFTAKQLEAERSADTHGYLLYGGAAGPGKSYFLRKYPIKFLVGCFAKLKLRGVRGGLFCEDYPALWDRHINRIPYEFPAWLGVYNSQQHEFRLADKYGGGVLAFRNLDDPSKYMSAEFALIAIDELTKNERKVFDFLRLRKRWTGIQKTKFIAGTNPGGIGHEWVKKIWVDRRFDDNEKEADQFVFLRALPRDNPYLDANYYRTLDSLPEALRRAYRDGNWDVFAGQFFSEWNAAKHVVAPVVIPESWQRFRSYDYGHENPACCKWYALDYDGRVWVYREKYWPKGHKVDAEQQGKEIVRLSEGETYRYSVADPSIFSPTGMVDRHGGQTIAEVFIRCGVVFTRGSNRRLDGWNIMHRYLRYDETQPPRILYFSTCHDSIRTIPVLIHDEKRPEDINTQGEDHAADCDRYFLMSLHDMQSPRPLNEIELKLAKLRERESPWLLSR